MTSTNKPDRLTCDAFSDQNIKNLPNSGVYTRFTNTLSQPLLNVKGIQLLRANFVNSVLQLNDYNGQLFFLYYRADDATSAGIILGNMHCVRLHPSWFVPKAAFTDYTKNKYFNTVSELVTSLNAAASTNGDDATFNPTWLSNDVSFSYDATTRKISFVGNTSANYYAPVAYDDPNVALFFANNVSYTPKMNGFTNSAGDYAGATTQPWILGNTMNPRLGFAMAYNTRGRWAGGSAVVGCATSTQVPSGETVVVESDSYPILIGAQNLNVFCSILGASGQSSNGRKNLLACIPLETAALNVNSYTLTSVEGRELSVANEIYELTFDMTDDFGNPFYFNPNYNTQYEMNVYYAKQPTKDNGTYYLATKSFNAPKN
jgi:hypothetical protein